MFNTRRDFLRLGTAGLMGFGLSDLLRLQATAAPGSSPKAKSVIMLWLAGGPATIDMWDPKPEAPAEIRGEFKPIDTSLSGLQISEHLPLMAKVMHQCTVVRSLYHTIPSHDPGTVYMHTGHKPEQSLSYPSLGSLTAKLLEVPKGVPPYVTFGNSRNRAGMAGYLGTAYNPFEIEGDPSKGQLQARGLALPEGFSMDQLNQRNQLLEKFDTKFDKLAESSDLAGSLDQFQQQALDVLRAQATKSALDLSKESDAVRERYGKDTFGQGALAARRLVEAGVRFVSVGMGGWDTHNGNFKKLKETNLPQLDRTFSALIEDLDQRGLLKETIIYCAGEFGRTPKVNKNGGRDHWARSMAVVLAGGGFKRGTVYGSTDAEGGQPAANPCMPADICATMLTNLGVDLSQMLDTPSGRSLSLFREGKTIADLVG